MRRRVDDWVDIHYKKGLKRWSGNYANIKVMFDGSYNMKIRSILVVTELLQYGKKRKNLTLYKYELFLILQMHYKVMRVLLNLKLTIYTWLRVSRYK